MKRILVLVIIAILSVVLPVIATESDSSSTSTSSTSSSTSTSNTATKGSKSRKVISTRDLLRQQQKKLDAEKAAKEKLQRENDELQKKILGGNDTQKPAKQSWWDTDSKKDCVGASSVGAFIGSTILGYGIGDHNNGAQVAGEAILLAILIAPSDSSFRCIIGSSLIGGGIGYWGGLDRRQKEEKEAHNKDQQGGEAAFGAGDATAGGGGTTTPPPPPPNAPAIKVMPFFTQAPQSIKEDGILNPSSGSRQTGTIGITFDFHF